MLSFNFFDSIEWEAISNEALIDFMLAKIATLESHNDALRSDNKNMETIIKDKCNYISELEATNEKLLIQDGVCINSNLNTKIANQSKEITRLLKNQEKLKAEVANDEKTISALQSNNAMLLKKIEELYAGIRNSEDLTWKEKYDELEARYKGNNEQNDETCKKLWKDINHISERCRKAEITLSNIDDIIKENGYRKE